MLLISSVVKTLIATVELVLTSTSNHEFYRKIQWLTREFHIEFHEKNDIARIAKR